MRSIDHYRMVLEIEKAGSVSKAAGVLHMTQPYLSSILKSIESELGFDIFTRSSSGVSLTKAGSLFIQYASEIQELILKIEEIPKVIGDDHQSLTVAGFYSYTLLDLYYSYKEHSPDAFTYQEVPNSDIMQMVESKKIQMGILYIENSRLKRFKSLFLQRGLFYKEIFREPICAIMGKNHPLKSQKELTLEDLKAYPLLIETYKTELDSYGDEVKGIIAKFQNFKVDPLHFDNNRSLFYYLLKSDNHFSVGLASHNVTNPFVKTEDLYYIPLKEPEMVVVTGTLVCRGDENLRAIKLFSERIVEYYSEFQSKNSLTV